MIWRVLKAIGKWVFRLAMFVMGLYLVVFLLLIWLLNSPDVQNRLVPWVRETLSEQLGTTVELRAVRLALFDEVVLEGLAIHDQWGNRFIQIEELRVGVLNLSLIDFLRNTDDPKRIGARTVRLVQPRVMMIRNPQRVWNYRFLIQRDSTRPPPTNPLSLVLEFPNVELEDAHFDYTDSAGNYAQELITAPFYFNYRKFQFSNVQFQTSFFLDENKFASLGIDHLEALEAHSGIHLHQFEGIVSGYVDSSSYALPGFTPSVMFQGMHAGLNGTNLDFDLVMDDELITTLFHRKNRNVDMTLRPSVLDLAVLSFWTRGKVPLDQKVELEGRFYGDYHHVRSELMHIAFPGGQTDFNLAFELLNYVHPDSMFMRLLFEPSTFVPVEIQHLMAGTDSLPEMLFRYGPFGFHGTFEGLLSDFNLEAVVQNDNGSAEMNLHLVVPPDSTGLYEYEGTFATQGFNLDTLLAQRSSRSLNSTGQVQGRGFAFSTMSLDGNVRIGSSDVYGYLIDSASSQITIANKVLKGHLRLADAHGNFDGRVSYDLSGLSPRYQAFGDIHRLDLNHYGLRSDTMMISALVNVDLTGDSLDVLNGYTRAFLIRLEKPEFERPLMLNNTVLNITTNGPRNKQFSLSSDWFSLEASGSFRYKNTMKMISTFLYETQFFLINDSLLSAAHYAKNEPLADTASFDFAIQTRYLDDVFRFFMPRFQHLQIGSTINGHARFGKVSEVAIVCDIDSMLIDSIGITNLIADVTLLKSATKNELLGGGRVDMGSLVLSKSLAIDNIVMRPRILGNHVSYTLTGEQRKPNNPFRLRARTIFANNQFDTRIDADSSHIIIGDTLWRFVGLSRVLYGTENQLLIENFRIQHGLETVDAVASINMPNREHKPLTFTLDNVDMAVVNKLVVLENKMAGELNVELKILDVFTIPILSANGRIHEFQVDDVKIGNLWTFSEYSNSTEKLKLNVILYQNNVERLSLDGTFDPYDSISPLNFRVASNDLPLNILEPFYKDYLYNVEGRLDIGRVFITGKLSAPRVRGLITLDRLQVGVKYLNQLFFIDDNIKLEDQRIVFNRVQVFDKQVSADAPSPDAHHLFLNGDITLNTLTDVRFNLSFDVPDEGGFRIMNTGREHNDSFFGRAVLDAGHGTVLGNLDALEIDAYVRPGRGTVMSIPLDSYTEGQRQDFIRFVGQEVDSVRIMEDANATKIDFQLTVEATPLAEIRLIFDEQAGDVISARGTGNIDIEYLPSGELFMSGVYEISEGDYLFTFRNIINKEFRIERGGTIAWSGDPYNAQLNITAMYRRDVSLSSLDTTLSGSRPVEVLMVMTDELLKPKIDFRINVPNLTQDQSYRIISKLAYIENDQAELNRQVFSLLLFNQFAPIGGFVSDGTAGVGSSVSEFLSSQLNSLIGQSLRTDNISIRLETAQEVVNLALRLSLLDDRLTIERNGSIVGGSQTDVSLGNISIQFRILPPPNSANRGAGVLVAEVFNRENVLSNSVVSSNRGVGLFYRQDFDRLADIFRRRRWVAPNPDSIPEPPAR